MKLNGMSGSGGVPERAKIWHEQPTSKSVIHCTAQVPENSRFLNEAQRSAADGIDDQLLHPMHALKDNPGARTGSTKFSECLNAAELRHRLVQDEDVWIEAKSKIQCLASVQCDGKDIEFWRKQRSQRCQSIF